MNLEFIELDLDWPSELSVVHLKNYIFSKLMKYGEPLRWAITSIRFHSDKKTQIISIEVVLIVHPDRGKGLNTEFD